MPCPETVQGIRDTILQPGGIIDGVSCVYFSQIGAAATLMIIMFAVGLSLAAVNRGIAGVAAIAIILGPAILSPLPAIAVNLIAVIVSLFGLVAGVGLYLYIENQTF